MVTRSLLRMAVALDFRMTRMVSQSSKSAAVLFGFIQRSVSNVALALAFL